VRAVALRTHYPSIRSREQIPRLLVRDLMAIGLLTADRPSARARLERALGHETAALARRLAAPGS
jgi:hypothetical protein